MGQALYRKYRSKSLSEIIGQEHITSTLEQALKTGRISHAYLFTGPRGTGKTSVARILAHEINNLPYTDDSAHMDIIEIDAASNRRIDEIRELREKVFVAPTSAKYKVYIIDEVHMLTKEAFNALLKTLEEPPAHVVFILATTDSHKLPATIVSRTQRFMFRPVERSKVIEHLKVIAKGEGITVSNEALELLAEHGEGSFRDSISLLDQAANKDGKLELSDAQQLLGIPAPSAITALLAGLSGATVAHVVNQLTSLYDQGYQPSAIAKQISSELRLQVVQNKLQLPVDTVMRLLSDCIDVPSSYDPERYLEITLLRAISIDGPAPIQRATPVVVVPIPDSAPAPAAVITVTAEPDVEVPVKPSTLGVVPMAPKPAKNSDAQVRKSDEQPISIAAPESVAVTPTEAAGNTVDESLWPQILGSLKQKYNTLYGVVRMAEPTFSDNKLQLAFTFAFHQKRINDAKNKKIIADIIEDLSGQSIQIEAIYSKEAIPKTVTAIAPTAKGTPANPDDIAAVNNIFGGGEMI
ncbi:DNA polymerase III subunit gamma/tau [Candidatus Saccharibacteria bacterium]|nr:DNA polymerase III subunit gamma/tau [Candidatus Saccharibacteria bacterium]